MVRKWSLILALVLWMASTGVYALGLGEIQLKSALNQNFNAEIELLSVDMGTLDDVRVSLASEEAFSRAGVERPFFLTKLRFKPERKADGDAIIRVSSNDPVREPFLNFLIEVNWPKGRLVREYTVLLDPPVTLARKPAPVQAPTAAPSPAPAKAAVKAPVSIAEGSYTVNKGDSLWRIASRSQHQGADINQMMMAIYKANPDAFFNGNINNLKAGAILRIPDQDEVLQISRTEARDQYQQQVNAWMSQQQGATVAAEAEAEEIAPIQREETEVAAETEAPQEAAVEEAAEAELKIATARPEGEGEAGASDVDKAQDTVARLNTELMLTQEGIESAKQEGEELQSRVQELEQQLENAERILAIKSAQLAQLQNNMGTGGEALPAMEEAAPEATPAEEAPAVEEEPAPQAAEEAVEVAAEEMTEPAATPEQEAVAEAAPEESAEPAADAQPVAEEPAAAPAETTDTAEPVAAATAQPQASAPEPKPVAEAKPAPQPAPAPKPQPAPEPGLLDGLFASTGMMGVLLGVGLVVLALVWIVVRRRQAASAEEVEFAESILLEQEDDEEESESTSDLSDESAPSEDVSLLTEFSPEDNLDALQDETSEVDPLSEADVYIAYGRYQQAEELIRQAINKDPDRDVLKHKLFEILFAVKDAEGFSKLAQESAGSSVEQSDPDAWQKVISMGREIDPDNALFAGGPTGETTVLETDTFQVDDDILDFGEEEEAVGELNLDEEEDELDLDALAAELETGDLAGEETLGDLGDLDLESFTTDADSSAAQESEDLSLDLGSAEEERLELPEEDSLDLDLGEQETAIVGEETGILDEETLIMGEETGILGAETLVVGEETGILGAETEVVGQETTTVLDTDDFALELPESEDGSDIGLELDVAVDDDEIKVSLEENDMELATPEEAQPTLDGDSIMLDAPNVDEVNTKLDLARAYIDMGDAEGAGYILDEVLVEGDEAQKQQAQELQGQLSQ